MTVGGLNHTWGFSSAGPSPPPRFERFLRAAAKVMTHIEGHAGRIYFPAIATDPNAGPKYGILPTWLWTDDHGQIRHLLAPSLTYNQTFGFTPTFRYYFYPTAESRLFVIGSRAWRNDYRAAIRYRDRDFLHGRCTLEIDLNHEAEGALRFFGFGPRSPSAAEVNYTRKEELVQLEVGIPIVSRWQIVPGWRFHQTEIAPGAIDSLPQIPQVFQGRATLWLPRMSLVRDSRDRSVTPTRGSYTEVFTEVVNPALGHEVNYQRYGGEWRWYVPHRANRGVATVRGLMDWAVGGELPFAFHADLGGARLLRGFGEGRFLDRGRLVVNFEERWTVYTLEVVSAVTQFQLAPFVEVGQVFRTPDRLRLKDVEPVAGVAVRAIVPPTVVGTIDFGVGREGPAIFIGVDYPF